MAGTMQLDVLTPGLELGVAVGDHLTGERGQIQRLPVRPVLLRRHAVQQQNLRDQVFETCRVGVEAQ
jgi:hypothetical protein